jgi:hypothetical protein
MDWATEAAIRALTYLGCQYEPIAPDIHEAFQLLADHRPDLGHWQWQEALYSCWKQLSPVPEGAAGNAGYPGPDEGPR